MISVEEADKILADNTKSFPDEVVHLESSSGRVLREPILADRDYPPSHRSMMDGIAVKSSAVSRGIREFQISGTIAAGQASPALESDDSCFEIMTGALLPENTDAVIPVEHLSVSDQKARLSADIDINPFTNVHQKSTDYEKGDLLVNQGRQITPQILAIAAATGKAKIKVNAQPHIAVIGTGNEIVDVDVPVKDFQVRRSNGYAVQSILDRAGFDDSTKLHLRDDKEDMLMALKEVLKKYDVIILSGGVSKGKFDFVPEILNELGVETLFHQVRQKPGRPFWFGITNDGKPVFALPGNPVSTQILTYRYVVPYLLRAAGCEQLEHEIVEISDHYESPYDITSFVPVVFEEVGDNPGIVDLKPFETSGSLNGLLNTIGFVELPEGQSSYPASFTTPLTFWF